MTPGGTQLREVDVAVAALKIERVVAGVRKPGDCSLFVARAVVWPK